MQPDGIIAKYCIGMVKNLKGIVSLKVPQLKVGPGQQLVVRKVLKRDGQKTYQSALNNDKCRGNDVEKNEIVCNTSDVKEDLFSLKN